VYTVRRTFRGADYEITVRNPAHVECGVRQITVDGRAMTHPAGVRHATLPPYPRGTVHTVEIVLGKV